jgi:hypothetical protein
MKKIIVVAFIAACSLSVFAQHSIQMKSGEKRIGKVQSLNNGVVDFLYKGAVQKINTSDIYSINFVEGGESIVPEPKSGFKGEPGEKQVSSGDYKVRYKVADRVISKPPKIDNLTQEKGTVVVEIAIDKYGHVKKAVPGAPGSTTTSEYLKTKAMQAAQSAIFESVPTAPLEQTGYMVIVF